jgi:Sigma-70, region 4
VPKRKIVYRNWIVEVGADPKHREILLSDNAGPPYNQRIIRAVRAALSSLTAPEKEFVERYYFQGETCTQIAEALGQPLNRVEGLQRRVVAKLKKELREFVRKEFDLEIPREKDCPLCASPFRAEIDNLIRAKRKEETWRGIIGVLRSKYRLAVKGPQVLIGHRNCHIKGAQNEN